MNTRTHTLLRTVRRATLSLSLSKGIRHPFHIPSPFSFLCSCPCSLFISYHYFPPCLHCKPLINIFLCFLFVSFHPSLLLYLIASMLFLFLSSFLFSFFAWPQLNHLPPLLFLTTVLFFCFSPTVAPSFLSPLPSLFLPALLPHTNNSSFFS